MSNFLENLKKSVESGDFNSEAAKKIIEIDNAASGIEAELKDTANPTDLIEEKILDRLENAGIKTVTEEEAALANSEYEKTMLKIKDEEAAMKVIATLTDIEHMVSESIEDMLDYIIDIEESFKKENVANDNLFKMIMEIKKKYFSYWGRKE